ncbi:hypothetical protein F0562_017016 [Nyssa sinensis]|uniref:HMA domain-containing protein n=1 Tax=Nyssa sinensis TaxID=561372 RepID=A0A5J4ZG81_9ASTE|nr:hypothetical protein F0562_017016 [Nyssa sinensis]
MRGIDIFCASQAATAIRMSMDEGSSSSASSSSTIHLSSSPAIDRHNPIIRDSRRLGNSSSEPPITSKPHNHHHHKTRKSSSKANDHHQAKKNSAAKPNDQKRKSCDKRSDNSIIVRKSSAKPSDLISPPTSSRYLLSDTAFLDEVSDFDPVFELVPVENNESQALKPDGQSSASKPPSSSHSPEQVVVLRVSLHCKGCEGKVRKHISRMKGNALAALPNLFFFLFFFMTLSLENDNCGVNRGYILQHRLCSKEGNCCRQCHAIRVSSQACRR